jgi:hypothetical protein
MSGNCSKQFSSLVEHLPVGVLLLDSIRPPGCNPLGAELLSILDERLPGRTGSEAWLPCDSGDGGCRGNQLLEIT